MLLVPTSTLKSLTWTVLLLFVILYLFSVLFTQGSAHYFINDYCQENQPCPEDTIKNTPLHSYFGSIPKSMFTLFKTLTGGESWGDVEKPLEDVSIFWAIFFVAFISFCYLAVLNVVTGIVCTTAIESATEDIDMQVQATLAEKEKYSKQLVSLFHNIDIDQSEQLSLDEILFVMKADPWGVATVCDAMEIKVGTAWGLFKILDTDGSMSIELEEFVEDCVYLCDHAKVDDICLLMHECKARCKKLVIFERYFQEDFLIDIHEQLCQAKAAEATGSHVHPRLPPGADDGGSV